ncbi:MAG: TylF/MycF/NovP-related O-methyltransferase, partial [Chloroflexota bacterium]
VWGDSWSNLMVPSASKGLVKRGFEASGYRLKRLDTEDEAAWLDYTAYPRIPEPDIIGQYTERIRGAGPILLVGDTPFTDRLLIHLDDHDVDADIIYIVTKNPTPQTRPFPAVTWEQIRPEPDWTWILCDPPHAYLDYRLLRDLGVPEPRLVYKSLFTRSPWVMADLLATLYEKFDDMPETMVDDARLLQVSQCVAHASHIKGDIIEVGSYRGGTGYLICESLLALGGTDKQVMLMDWYREQSDDVSPEGVHRVFEKYPFAELFVGKAQDVIKDHSPESLSLVHIDINVDEEIVSDLLWPLYEKLTLGGLMLFDNYYFRFPTKYAIDQFAKQIDSHIMLLPSIPQGLLIKTKDNIT